MNHRKKRSQTSTANSNELTLKDVTRVIQAGRLLLTTLTHDELRELVAANGGDVAERDKTGTGFATTHRSRHLPSTRLA
jgi:hypothetical protein